MDADTLDVEVVVAETVEEQMEYGAICIHGRNLGTPGGADLMCGYCEEGMDTWVDDSRYALFLSVKEPLEHKPPLSYRPMFSWRESIAEDAWTEMYDWANKTITAQADWSFAHWNVFEMEKGYWI